MHPELRFPHLIRLSTLAQVTGYGAAAAAILLTLWFVVARPIEVLPRISPAPSFVLTDQRGAWVSDTDLQGSILIVSFSFTRCSSHCAAQQKQLLALEQNIRQAAPGNKPILFLMISIDPTHDTPAVLHAYAEQPDTERRNWRFLTGHPSEIKQLVGGGFGVYYQEPDAGHPVGRSEVVLEHAQRVVLIDDTGIIRAEYDGNALDPARIARHIALIEQEAASSGVSRAAYEAAHLFVCYAD